MKQWKWAAVAAACAMVVAGCGGGGNGNQAPAVQYSSVVSFGDSLSDAGTYGGKFTVNGITGVVGSDPVPSYTWAQLISAAATGSVSCPARIGGFGILETTSAGAGCTNYAQGGSRVLARNGVDYRPYVEGTITDGPLTEPVVTQVTHYLADAANGGKFTGKELVTVLAGANDIFGQVDILKADATAAGNAAGGQAFVAALAGALAAGATTPATAGPAIAGAFVAAKAAGASDQLAVSAAIQAAAAAGNTTVMNMVYINSVVVAGKQAGGATFPANLVAPLIAGLAPANQGTAGPAIGLAINTEAVKATATLESIIGAAVTAAVTDKKVNSYVNPNLANAAAIGAAASTAFSNAFGQSVVGALAANATSPVTAATAIGTAMAQAKATATAAAGATSTSIMTAAVNAAVQAAAAAGNTVVMNMPFINATVAAATATATTAGTTAGNAYAVSQAAHDKAVAGMQTAAADLVTSIKGMLASGATHIVVSNLPDVSETPMAMATIVYAADGVTVLDHSQQDLTLAMTTAFNTALQTGLAGTAGVMLVDVFSENVRQMANPAHYALTNIRVTACDLNAASNLNRTSLHCNLTNLIAGDTSHYMFADSVHPTPYGHKLLAQYVTKALVIAGWL